MNTADQRIDRLLHTLGTATTPSGLEQRINARLAQHASPRKRSPSFHRFAGIRWTPRVPYRALWPSVLTVAVIVLGAGCLYHFTHTQPQPVAQESGPALLPQLPSVQHASPVRILSPGHAVVLPQLRTVAGPQASSPINNDPDAIALAETFAPSHAAPPMPLSEQETVLTHSVRRGAPIEVATFDARYEPVASVLATARERASVREFVHGLLGPLATAQALTSSSPRPDDTPTVADPEPPSSQ